MRSVYLDLHLQPSYKHNDETPPKLSGNIQSNFSSNQSFFQIVEDVVGFFYVILNLIEFLKKHSGEEGRLNSFF